MTPDDLDAVCRDVFPMKGANELASLEYVEATGTDEWVRLVLRLIVWEADTRSIRDIKEQECAFVEKTRLATLSSERVRAFLEGLATVLARALSSPHIETMLPHELFLVNVLKLKTAVTAEDFVKALGAKSRLGALLTDDAAGDA